MEQRHPVGAVPSLVSSDATAIVGAEDTPKERPPIDLFKSIFESESESDSDDEDESEGEGTAAVAGEAESTPAAPTPTAPPTEVRKSPESLFDKKSLHRGYGTDSSDESTGTGTGQLGAAHRVDDSHSKKLEQGGTGREGKRRRGESDSTSRKHGHKHKKHKKDKKDKKNKKHRKHDKRKNSSKK